MNEIYKQINDPIYESEIIFSQSDFDSFAKLSGDFNPIHVDPEFSAQSSFGKTVAHGIFLYSHLYEAFNSQMISKNIVQSKILFPAPTFANVPMLMTIEEIHAEKQNGKEYLLKIREKQTNQDCCVVKILIGENIIQPTDEKIAQESATPNEALKIGQICKTTRIFDAATMADYTLLFNREKPAKFVPKPLINAVFSKLLGIDLPGLGTNYLKQETDYIANASIGTELVFSVQVTRLRPDKKLVDLHCECKTIGGALIANGRALVSARDVKNAFG